MTKIKADRKAIADVFVKVLRKLPDTVNEIPSPYICDNIFFTATPAMSTKVQAIICERINNKFSIEGWLKDQSDVIAEQVRHDVMFNKGRKLQEYRKAWVRELIKEFSA